MLLEVRAHSDRPEKADAAPVRHEVGTDQPAIERGAERGDVRCAPAAVDVVPIAPECLRVGGTEKRAKRLAEYALGPRQITLGKWSYHESASRWFGVSTVRSNGHILPL